MTGITKFNANTLPALKPLESIDRRSKEVDRLLLLEYSRNGVSDHDYLAQIELVMPHLPQWRGEMLGIGHRAGVRQLGDGLSVMRAGFPNSKIPESFCTLLIERVAAHQPTLAALDWTVREIVDRAEFFPGTVSIVLHTLEVAQARYDRTLRAADTLPAKRDQLAAAVAEAKRDQAERAAAAVALREACRQILGTDDREAFEDMVRGKDEALKDRVRTRRDELLAADAPPPA